MTAKPNNINDILMKMKTMTPQDDEYAFYWELVIESYHGLIRNLCKNRAHAEDFYHECILKIPDLVESWDIEKGAFSTHLVWTFRGFIQGLEQRTTTVNFNKTMEKYYAKKHNRIERTVSYINLDKPNDLTGDSSKREFFLPLILSTIEADIHFEQLMTIASEVEDFNIWKSYYMDDAKIKDLAIQMNLPNHAVRKRIKKANDKIAIKLKGKT